MKFGRLNDNSYILRLEKGEEMLDTISSFCNKHSIHNGSFIGLGSVENVTLAHYRVDIKKYSEKMLSGIFEVTNLTGMIATYENKPLVHAHVTLSDEEMGAFGGHLVKGVVSATLEVVINVYPSSFKKTYNEEIGLKLFDLAETG